MLINAQPRIFSNGFEPFVPTRREESLTQRLVEMTNNDINAWSVFGPVAPSVSTTDSWDKNIDDCGDDGNFAIQNLYGGYLQETSSVPEVRAVNHSKSTPYTALYQGQCQVQKTPSTSMYDEQISEMNCFEKPSSIVGNAYQQWRLADGRGSPAEFSARQNTLNSFSYQKMSDPTFTPFTSTLPLAQPNPSYQLEDSSQLDDSLNLDTTSPSTVYSNYSGTSSDSMPTVCVGGPILSMRSAWWPETSRGNIDQCYNAYSLCCPNDGLPRSQNLHQQYFDFWNMSGRSATSWAAQSSMPSTISPKVLALNVSPPASSSSSSSQGTLLSLPDSNSVSIGEDTSDMSGHETFFVLEAPENRRPRRLFPSSATNFHGSVPVLLGNDFATNKTTKNRPLKAKSGTHPHLKTNSQDASTATTTQCLLQEAGSSSERPTVPKWIEPKPVNPIVRPLTDLLHSATLTQDMHNQDAKNDFLVRSKLAGMSYKEIRQAGNFTEAESTLRGRFRTLTKHKAARVRKPEWNDNDIELLKKAVGKLIQGSNPSRGRVPWKQVADYIANNGGSYHFGNATCRKKWDELHTWPKP